MPSQTVMPNDLCAHDQLKKAEGSKCAEFAQHGYASFEFPIRASGGAQTAGRRPTGLP
ncbi:MAG TPA: hypothetical protein QGF05_15115 [Dehalococcoidia bacterium]|nr:hypothetical protein [Dehalococcoidia bacterium]